MKLSLSFPILFILSVSFLGFTKISNLGLNATYGVSSNDPSNIALVLSEDLTYTYQDFSDPNNKISVTGTYKMKGNTVVLNSKSDSKVFHHKWKLKQGGKVATSRLGLCFYRLGLQE